MNLPSFDKLRISAGHKKMGEKRQGVSLQKTAWIRSPLINPAYLRANKEMGKDGAHVRDSFSFS